MHPNPTQSLSAPFRLPGGRTPKSARRRTHALLAACALASMAGVLRAQSEAPAAPATPADPAATEVPMLDSVVVTGVARPGATRLKTSVSLSSVDASQVQISAPRSTAEIFRTIPGFRSEATSGDGNANITVRGAPISAGGARYLQLQEDGLPLLQFGDIAFATSDSFLRADNSLQRIESIRGGSASTFASNSPGGIINFISKTGEVEGGSLGYSSGLTHTEHRLDLDYGGKINDGLRFHAGGFYHTGEGTRDTGFNGIEGYQFKANLTKDFANGYVRAYFKHLNDSTPTYMPMPMRVTGSNGDADFGSVANFDHKFASLYSPYLTRALVLDGEGNRTVTNVDDGLHVESTSIGLEGSFDLGDEWNITNRFRAASNNGNFASPFPAQVADAQTIANSIGGVNSTLRYANGPKAGQTISNPAALNGNGLLNRVHLFNTSLNNFDSAANDLRVNKLIELNSGSIDVTGGVYFSRQNVDMDWLWNTYLQEVRGDAALIDVVDENGRVVTDKGLVAYGTPFWGNLRRNYDVSYDTFAPFVSVGAEFGDLNLDASIRHDTNEAQGSYAGGSTLTNFDLNQDGVISVPEQSVEVVNNTARTPVNYKVNFTSYSLGANYAFTKSLAVFGRYSLGASASADRILFGNVLRPDGSIVGDQASYNELRQAEVGVKYQTKDLVPGNLAVFATLFNAETTESNYELTSQRFTNRVYVANGVELEVIHSWGDLDVRVGATFTDAEIDKAETAALVGNTPRRQADFVYHVTPTYRFGKLLVGGSLIGTTAAYAQDDNQLKFPAYAYVNAFAAYEFTKGLSATVSANNVFNTFGVSEAEEGSIPGSGIVRARGITGRTVTAALRYSF